MYLGGGGGRGHGCDPDLDGVGSSLPQLISCSLSSLATAARVDFYREPFPALRLSNAGNIFERQGNQDLVTAMGRHAGGQCLKSSRVGLSTPSWGGGVKYHVEKAGNVAKALKWHNLNGHTILLRLDLRFITDPLSVYPKAEGRAVTSLPLSQT